MFGLHAFSAAPLSSTVSSGPVAFEPDLDSIAAATVSPLVITPDLALSAVQPVSFGAMHVPYRWAPALTSVQPVSISGQIRLVRFTASQPRKTIFRLTRMQPVQFGAMTLP